MTLDELLRRLTELHNQGYKDAEVEMATDHTGNEFAVGRFIGGVSIDEHGVIWIQEDIGEDE